MEYLGVGVEVEGHQDWDIKIYIVAALMGDENI